MHEDQQKLVVEEREQEKERTHQHHQRLVAEKGWQHQTEIYQHAIIRTTQATKNGTT